MWVLPTSDPSWFIMPPCFRKSPPVQITVPSSVIVSARIVTGTAESTSSCSPSLRTSVPSSNKIRSVALSVSGWGSGSVLYSATMTPWRESPDGQANSAWVPTRQGRQRRKLWPISSGSGRKPVISSAPNCTRARGGVLS